MSKENRESQYFECIHHINLSPKNVHFSTIKRKKTVDRVITCSNFSFRNTNMVEKYRNTQSRVTIF